MDFSVDHTEFSAVITDISGYYIEFSFAYLDCAPHDIEPSSAYTEFSGVWGGGFAEFSSAYPW